MFSWNIQNWKFNRETSYKQSLVNENVENDSKYGKCHVENSSLLKYVQASV